MALRLNDQIGITSGGQTCWYILGPPIAGRKARTVMDVPVIHTARLTLRGHRVEDFDALVAMWADSSVVRFIGGKPSTRDETWSRLLRYAGHWSLLGFGFWAVELTAESRFVGDVGFADWKREISPSLDGMPEGGWVFSPDVHGMGIANEAVQAALAWMDTRFKGATTSCIISEDNVASVRVAQKNGYREFARSDFKGSVVVQYRR